MKGSEAKKKKRHEKRKIAKNVEKLYFLKL